MGLECELVEAEGGIRLDMGLGRVEQAWWWAVSEQVMRVDLGET